MRQLQLYPPIPPERDLVLAGVDRLELAEAGGGEAPDRDAPGDQDLDDRDRARGRELPVRRELVGVDRPPVRVGRRRAGSSRSSRGTWPRSGGECAPARSRPPRTRPGGPGARRRGGVGLARRQHAPGPDPFRRRVIPSLESRNSWPILRDAFFERSSG